MMKMMKALLESLCAAAAQRTFLLPLPQCSMLAYSLSNANEFALQK